MRTWTSTGLWCSIATAGLLAAGCKPGSLNSVSPGRPTVDPVGPVGPALSQADCNKLHGQWPDLKLATQSQGPTTFAMGHCPLAGCGLNGAWLGSGVAFRTLHVTAGTPNPQGVRIREFRKGSDPLRIEVAGQELRGVKTTGEALQDAALVGADLYLDQLDAPGHVATAYKLTITGSREEDFWARCTLKDGCGVGPPPKARIYTFQVHSSDGCEIELCRPGLIEGYKGGLTGDAVIFRGDYYDEATHQVSTSPASAYDQDVFNVACLGTAISKLHLLRHTTAADPTADPTATDPSRAPPTVDQRQAVLRTLTADYCGTGGAFTDDGLPISLALRNPRWAVNNASGYLITDPGTGPHGALDAVWKASGAVCIGTPRRASVGADPAVVLRDVAAACASIGRPMPGPCTDPDTAPVETLLGGGYAAVFTSATPIR